MNSPTREACICRLNGGMWLQWVRVPTLCRCENNATAQARADWANQTGKLKALAAQERNGFQGNHPLQGSHKSAATGRETNSKDAPAIPVGEASLQ